MCAKVAWGVLMAKGMTTHVLPRWALASLTTVVVATMSSCSTDVSDVSMTGGTDSVGASGAGGMPAGASGSGNTSIRGSAGFAGAGGTSSMAGAGGGSGKGGNGGNAATSGAGGTGGATGTDHVIASIPYPGQMILDGESLVVTSYDFTLHAGSLLRVSLVDGAVSVLAGGDPEHDIGMVLGASTTTFFFLQSVAGTPSAIVSLPRTGGHATKIADVAGAVNAITADASNVYWTGQISDPYSASDSGGLFVASLTGGTATTLVSGFIPGGGLVVDETNAYWTVRGDAPADPLGSGSVRWVKLAGGPVHLLATAQRRPSALVLSGGELFWIEAGTMSIDCTPLDGAIMKAALSDGVPTSVAQPLPSPESLAVEGDSVYFAQWGAFCNVPPSPSPGSVARIATSGGDVTLLASHQSGPGAIVATAGGKRVYWTTVKGADAAGQIHAYP